MDDKELAAELLELKEELEQVQETVGRAKGALEQVLKDIKAKFGCKTLREAEAKVQVLQSQSQRAKRMCVKALQEYKRRWREALDDDTD